MADTLNPFDGDIPDEAIDNWLTQFSADHRGLAAKLLSAFRYYSSRKVAVLVKNLHIAILSRLGPAVTDFWFVPVGYVAKSGSIISYFFRTQNNLPQDRFVAPADVAALPLGNSTAVVFLDDFVGSGNQACQVWDNVVTPLKQAQGCHFAYAVLVGTQQGLKNIEMSTGFATVSVETLTEADQPFSEASTLFQNEAERQGARDVLEEYGKQLYPNHPLGYKESQGLIGFFYSTPNNSLPVFWSTQQGWKPILAHGESYRDPAFLIGPPPGLSRESASDSPRKPIVDSQELDEYDIDPSMAIRIFSEFRKAPIFLVLAPVLKALAVHDQAFADMLTLIAELKHLEHEKQPVCSAILIFPEGIAEETIGEKMVTTASGVTMASVAEVTSLANLVDGLKGATAFRANGHALGNFLYGAEEYKGDPFLPQAYLPAAATSARTGGLLFLFSGGGRVTAFCRGQRILSYRGAQWHLHTAELERGIRGLSAKHGIDVPVLQQVFRLALCLADQGDGALLTVGNHDAVLKHSDPPKTQHLVWVEMHLGDTNDDTVLGLMSQDGATIISGSGRVVQGMTFLRPPAGTEAEEEVGKGSKHSTAAKVSKVTRAVSVAVSVDGRITVYSEGAVAFKMMG